MKSFCRPKNVDITSVEHNLKAVHYAFDEKLRRKDFQRLLIQTGEISRKELEEDLKTGQRRKINKAIYALTEAYTKEIREHNGQITFDKIREFDRVDGISGKLRHLCQESPKQQIFEYITKWATEELLQAKILPCQFGSIPGGGQVKCKESIEKIVRRRFGGDVDAVQIDIYHAYPSTKTTVITKIIDKYCHKNKPLCTLVKNVMQNYPGGVLIIGGFWSSWAFNLAMSFFLRRLLEEKKTRRGKQIRMVKAVVCFADDVLIFGDRSNLIKAIKTEGRWIKSEYGLTIKGAWTIIRFKRFDRHTKWEPRIDMAGYIVSSTRTTIRGAIFKRIRRQTIRAKEELNRLGYIPHWRAWTLTAYNGWLVHSDSLKFIRKHGYQHLFKMAKKSIRKHERQVRNGANLCNPASTG